jgi:general secretion pathway protein H
MTALPAPSAYTPSPITDRREGQAGVTLVEILVVLAILGVMTGVTALALPSTTRTTDLTNEAQLLASRLDIAAEQSLMSGRPAALDWGNGGYRFLEWSGSDWQAHRNRILGAPHDMGSASLDGDRLAAPGGRMVIKADLSPPDTRAAEETGDAATTLRLSAGDDEIRLRFDGATAWVVTQ